MKKAKWKRNMAIIGMIVLVIAGLLLGTIRDMAKFKREAKEIYESGQDLNGETIDTRIERICKNGRTLVKIVNDGKTWWYEQIVPAVELEKALNELEKADQPSEKYRLLKEICEHSSDVYRYYSDYNPDAALRAFSIIDRSMERLEDFRADYNESAKNYNKKINSFPYVFVAKPFLKELSLFD